MTSHSSQPCLPSRDIVENPEGRGIERSTIAWNPGLYHKMGANYPGEIDRLVRPSQATAKWERGQARDFWQGWLTPWAKRATTPNSKLDFELRCDTRYLIFSRGTDPMTQQAGLWGIAYWKRWGADGERCHHRHGLPERGLKPRNRFSARSKHTFG